MPLCTQHDVHETTCHVEEDSSHWDSDHPTIVLAVCGASCLIDEDGHPQPCTFDFVLPKDAHLADCMPCLEALAQERSEKRETARVD